MNRDEILKRAQSESPDRQGDEREKMIFDKSFYWAFLTMGALATVFACIRAACGQEPFDIMAMIMGAASGAFIYRFVRAKKPVDLVLAAMMTCITIFAVYRFFRSI